MCIRDSGGPGQLRTGPGARDSSGRVRGPGQGPGTARERPGVGPCLLYTSRCV
ncbi:hypothetical protein [Streptomyces fragilis]|uniref:hypothetical protein n=1 Tax=Streptomyces fragilis TaxID=67301 RepID=UPI0024DF01C1|nr:hypothetical protein [Streptomyces fragilis]